MTTTDALQQLKHGNSIDCATPDGKRFQIQSKLSYGMAWYRVRPAIHGCLNRYSRLSDAAVLQ